MKQLCLSPQWELDRAVTLDDLLLETYCHISQYVSAPQSTLALLSVWAVASHFTPALQLFPYLLITAPKMGQGKSVTASVVSKFAVQPVAHTSSTTAAAIYNEIEENDGQITLIIDEADQVLLDKEIAPILNGGHSRETALVKRNINNKNKSFNTFCPKIVAGINATDLIAPLTSRSIIVRLDPAKQGINSLTDDLTIGAITAQELNCTPQAISAWAAQNTSHFLAAYREIANQLKQKQEINRKNDNFKPLLALASMSDFRDGFWLSLIKEEMQKQSSSAEPNDKLDLLYNIKILIDALPITHEKIAVKEVFECLKEIPAYQKLTKNQLGRTLKSFGIESSVSNSTRYFCTKGLKEVFTKYLTNYVPF